MKVRISFGDGMSVPNSEFATLALIGAPVLASLSTGTQPADDVLQDQSALLGIGENSAQRPEDLAHHGR